MINRPLIFQARFSGRTTRFSKNAPDFDKICGSAGPLYGYSIRSLRAMNRVRPGNERLAK
jgi:hypothetical protein